MVAITNISKADFCKVDFTKLVKECLLKAEG